MDNCKAPCWQVYILVSLEVVHQTEKQPFPVGHVWHCVYTSFRGRRTINVSWKRSFEETLLLLNFKSHTQSRWEILLSYLESKYPLKYLHFTVKRIAKHKIMYKLKYSSFWRARKKRNMAYHKLQDMVRNAFNECRLKQ